MTYGPNGSSQPTGRASRQPITVECALPSSWRGTSRPALTCRDKKVRQRLRLVSDAVPSIVSIPTMTTDMPDEQREAPG